MDFLFLKALAASVRGQVSNLKSQVKRLAAASENVFGKTYPIETIRNAVAIANGYRNWSEVDKLAINTGQDRTLPAWYIENRNPVHEACLKALIQTDVHMSESHPVVVLGDVVDAALPAVCLWAEQISFRKEPGVIVIDTNIPTYQKTPIGLSAKKLGLIESFQRFRVIDAREPSIPLAMTGTVDEWLDAVKAGVSPADWKVLVAAKVTTHFRNLLIGFGNLRNCGKGDHFSSYALEQAARAIANPYCVDLSMFDKFGCEGETYFKEHFEADSENFPVEEVTRFVNVIYRLENVISDYGVLLRNETLHRPTIVLCSSDNSISMVIASLVRAMYLNRFVATRSIRPLLYCSTQKYDGLPDLFGFGNEAIAVTGKTDASDLIWHSYHTRSPMFVSAETNGIVVSGKWAEFG